MILVSENDTTAYMDIANSRSDVHFIVFSSLVILDSGRRNSYQLFGK